MSNENSLIGAYNVKGTIGNQGMPGAPVVHFNLVVVPSTHKVTGVVHITQATQGGNFTGNVTGVTYSTGINGVTKVVAIKGLVHPVGPEIAELEFDAHMAVNDNWDGTGGFNYGSVHIDNVPVSSNVNVTASAN